MKAIWTSLRRTPYQSLASFLILFFTLFLSLFLFTTISFFYGILPYVESKVQVIAYFQNKSSEKDIFKIRDSLKASGKTISIKYVSKQDAFNIYKQFNKNDPLLIEMVSADILPASLEIYAKQPSYLPELAEYLKKQPGVQDVLFEKSLLDKLLSITDTLRKVSLFIFILFMVISFLVLMTMTAFKIALKKDEIELLRLLGGSTFYIRKPFLLEGLFLGITSGIGASSLFYLLYLYFIPFLTAYLQGLPQLTFMNMNNINLYVWPPSPSFILLSFGITILFGAIIALLGNYLATSKYIK